MANTNSNSTVTPTVSSSDWMVRYPEGSEYGPFDRAEVENRIQRGQFVNGDRVSFQGGPWQLIEMAFPHMFPTTTTTPPTTPPQPPIVSNSGGNSNPRWQRPGSSTSSMGFWSWILLVLLAIGVVGSLVLFLVTGTWMTNELSFIDHGRWLSFGLWIVTWIALTIGIVFAGLNLAEKNILVTKVPTGTAKMVTRGDDFTRLLSGRGLFGGYHLFGWPFEQLRQPLEWSRAKDDQGAVNLRRINLDNLGEFEDWQGEKPREHFPPASDDLELKLISDMVIEVDADDGNRHSIIEEQQFGEDDSLQRLFMRRNDIEARIAALAPIEAIMNLNGEMTNYAYGGPNYNAELRVTWKELKPAPSGADKGKVKEYPRTTNLNDGNDTASGETLSQIITNFLEAASSLHFRVISWKINDAQPANNEEYKAVKAAKLAMLQTRATAMEAEQIRLKNAAEFQGYMDGMGNLSAGAKAEILKLKVATNATVIQFDGITADDVRTVLSGQGISAAQIDYFLSLMKAKGATT